MRTWGLYDVIHWNLSLQILVVMAMLIRVIGLLPAVAGCGVTIAMIPLITILGKRMLELRKNSMAVTDTRVKLSTEVLTGKICDLTLLWFVSEVLLLM